MLSLFTEQQEARKLTAGHGLGARGCSSASPGPPRLGTGRRRLCIQDGSRTTWKQRGQKTATVERPAAPRKDDTRHQCRGQREVSHSCINLSSGREDLIERLGLSPHRRCPPRPLASGLLTATNQPVSMESFQPPTFARHCHTSSFPFQLSVSMLLQFCHPNRGTL